MGFETFKKKHNMMNEEELRLFIGNFYKRQNFNFEKVKKSLIFMDQTLVDFLLTHGCSAFETSIMNESSPED